MIPQKIGRYLVEKELGRGGMGRVYLAFDPILEIRCAVKVMNAEEVDDELRRRFLLEARRLAKLNHPNIVSISNMDEDQKRPYIVMEYVPGEDLNSLIKKKKYVPFEQKLAIFRQICDGLHYAHDRDVVHRDIKPGNIRITPSGAVKILDFGLARLESADLTRTGPPMGTPYYMSPEQIRGSKLDRRSDLFSLGVVLYEWVSYCRPFEAENPSAVYFTIVSESHRPLRETMPGCAEELVEIVDKALAKDRKFRYSTCQELAADLIAFERRLPSIRADLSEEVKCLETEFARCQQRATQYEMLDWFEEGLFAEKPVDSAPETASLTTDISSRKQDYGYLVERRHSLEVRLERIGFQLKQIIPLLALIDQSQQQMENGELESASRTLETVLEKDPGNGNALRIREVCRELLGQKRMESERQRRLKEALAKGTNALKQGNIASSLPAVDRCVTLDPANAEALELRSLLQDRISLKVKTQQRLVIARGLLWSGKAEACLEEVENGLELDPCNPLLMELSLAASRAVETQRQKDRFLRDARQEISRGEYTDALATIDEVLKQNPHDAETLELQQECLDAMEQYSRFEELASAAKGSHQAGDHEACYEAAIQALQLIPDNLEMKQLRNESLQKLEGKAATSSI